MQTYPKYRVKKSVSLKWYYAQVKKGFFSSWESCFWVGGGYKNGPFPSHYDSIKEAEQAIERYVVEEEALA